MGRPLCAGPTPRTCQPRKAYEHAGSHRSVIDLRRLWRRGRSLPLDVQRSFLTDRPFFFSTPGDPAGGECRSGGSRPCGSRLGGSRDRSGHRRRFCRSRAGGGAGPAYRAGIGQSARLRARGSNTDHRLAGAGPQRIGVGCRETDAPGRPPGRPTCHTPLDPSQANRFVAEPRGGDAAGRRRRAGCGDAASGRSPTGGSRQKRTVAARFHDDAVAGQGAGAPPTRGRSADRSPVNHNGPVPTTLARTGATGDTEFAQRGDPCRPRSTFAAIERY